MHAFEFFVNMENKVVRAPRELMNLPQNLDSMGMTRLATPNNTMPEEPEPKFDESARLPPEDQFIAKHPVMCSSDSYYRLFFSFLFLTCCI